jgi:Uma2 family endonuclease
VIEGGVRVAAVTSSTETGKTIQAPAEARILLHGVSWETYELLLADHADRRAPRFTYERGELEIVSPSFEYERVAGVLADVVRIVAEELAIDFVAAGTMTVRRADLRRGFEPDASSYIQNVDRVRGLTQIDVRVDPPPDLAIETDVTHSSLDKLPIYAGLGVPEVWRYQAGRVAIFLLQNDSYRESERSAALPIVTDDVLTRFARDDATLTRIAWSRALREWARAQRSAAPPDR